MWNFLTKSGPRTANNIPPHDFERLKARVGGLAKDDPLWPLLLALLRSNQTIEIATLAAPRVEDGEAHRGRGRVGMLLDLEAQLNEVWVASHQAE